MSKKSKKQKKMLKNASLILELAAKQLLIQKEDNQLTFNEAVQKHNDISLLLANNKQICDNNVLILKRNATELFHVKECSIWLYEHYKNIISIIDKGNLMSDQNDREYVEKVYLAREEALNGVTKVEKYFTNTFGIHPEDYKKEKVNIKGIRQNGAGYVSDSSIN